MLTLKKNKFGEFTLPNIKTYYTTFKRKQDKNLVVGKDFLNTAQKA